MFINNSTSLMPSHLAAGFEPARKVMQMVNTINNRLAIRTDSFTKSAELEERVRTMMMEEEEAKTEKPAQMEIQPAFQNPIEARTETINVTTLHVTDAKDWVLLIKKHEAIIADENSSDEQRKISTKLNQSLKKLVEGMLDMSIYAQGSFSDGMGYISDMRSGSDSFSKLVELTGDLSAKGLGLTGFENMNSDQILEKLDGALAHLNEMGKLLNPGYTPPKIEPLSEEELNWFENLAGNWEFIVQKYDIGETKDPISVLTFSAEA